MTPFEAAMESINVERRGEFRMDALTKRLMEKYPALKETPKIVIDWGDVDGRRGRDSQKEFMELAAEQAMKTGPEGTP